MLAYQGMYAEKKKLKTGFDPLESKTLKTR